VVVSVLGSDVTGNGTEISPFKTLGMAMGANDNTIVLSPGNHDLDGPLVMDNITSFTCDTSLQVFSLLQTFIG